MQGLGCPWMVFCLRLQGSCRKVFDRRSGRERAPISLSPWGPLSCSNHPPPVAFFPQLEKKIQKLTAKQPQDSNAGNWGYLSNGLNNLCHAKIIFFPSNLNFNSFLVVENAPPPKNNKIKNTGWKNSAGLKETDTRHVVFVKAPWVPFWGGKAEYKLNRQTDGWMDGTDRQLGRQMWKGGRDRQIWKGEIDRQKWTER